MVDVILCLGSSLKVLKKYACLWCMNRPAGKRPKLYIVNLQVKHRAELKIHAKCDDVMSLLMEELSIQISMYDRAEDPIFSLATQLEPEEFDSRTREVIAPHNGLDDCLTDPGEQADVASAVQGGWFGQGYGKGRKK